MPQLSLDHGRRDFTLSELDYLLTWGYVERLEVGIVLTAPSADEVAFIGLGEKIALCTIHRAAGELWLTWLEEDRPMAIQSVEEACERVRLGLEASG